MPLTELEMKSSREFLNRSLQVAPGGVHSPVRAFKSVGGDPIFFKKAKGCHLLSTEGAQYLDFCMSFGPLPLGHRDPEVEEEVLSAIADGWSFGACEPYSLELAEWIIQRIPWVEKLRFVSSGTEAVMSALRVARAATGRTQVLKFDGCYHGHVDSMLVKSGSGLAGQAEADSAGIPESVHGETLICPLDDEMALEKIWHDHGSNIAALIIEPLPANYGLLIQRRDFVEKAVELARSSGALVIFDEVISGFRVAFGGMAELFGIYPDLVTYGKIVGGGFPVGCYGGKRELLDLVAPAGPVYQAGTLSANPVGMRAGLATLKKMERIGFHQLMEEKLTKLLSEINRQLEAAAMPIQVSGFSSMFWIHSRTAKPIRAVSQIPKNQLDVFKSIFHGALKSGIYLPPSGFEVGFLSSAHTQGALEQTAYTLVKLAKECFGK